ncbi:MAG TPA: hypothetical protein VFY99_00750 [Solirubrobacterales bacterium]
MLIVPDANGADPEAMAARRRQKSRRRAALWGAFLLVGLALGTIYATGFATTGGSTGATATAGANTNDPGANQDTSVLAGLMTTPDSNITFNWAGRWGSLSNAALYEADLDGQTGDYFLGVYLSNTPSGFSDLQIQFRIADVGVGGTCDGAAINGVADTDDYRVMRFDNNDAQVTFSGMNGVTTGLPGGSTYCVGVANYANNGKDTGGTFIRKVTTGGAFGGTYPQFVGTLNAMP